MHVTINSLSEVRLRTYWNLDSCASLCISNEIFMYTKIEADSERCAL